MPHERPEVGKSTEQIIEEVMAELHQGLFDEKERDEMIAKLVTARITTLPESDGRKKIDELLSDVRSRYKDS
ncbi:MAG: hypothetical protein KBD27_03020 [Candidatus Moranbacteria bacterium]|nr:hypothetical protein [Candidatus Moranbacteria bacterium]